MKPFTGDWTHDSGIVALWCISLGFVLGRLSLYLERRRALRDRLRGVPTRRAN